MHRQPLRKSFPVVLLLLATACGSSSSSEPAENPAIGPFVYFADPPAVYDGVDLTVTVHVARVSGSVKSVAAVPSGGGAPVSLAITDATQAGRVQVLVTAGTLAAGLHDVLVTDDDASGRLAGGLVVTSSLTVAVAAISPPFGWTGESVPIVITATLPPVEGQVAFASTPRVYLSPRSAGGVATELRTVSFLDEGRLSGSIPAGLPVDRYDLVVVNPDGAIGVLQDAFEMRADPSPVIAGLLPGSVPSRDDMAVTVFGSGFALDATAAASCRWVDDLLVAHTASLSAAVTFVDAGTLTTVWDFVTAGVPNTAVCVLRVDNPTEGTFADFSALSVTPASNTPNDFRASSPLVVGRRAPAGAALRMNTIDRFLFAVGGDNGLDGDALETHASVESARVDPYGVIEQWIMQRNALPEPRSFTTAAAVGRFVYLPGGRVAGSETASVLRAYLLDPEEAPGITGLDLAVDGATGLAGGRWIYRVSAILGAEDPSNPGGEGLASEPVTVRVPAVAGLNVQLTLFWAEVPNAAGYRVYRTAAVDGVVGEERLLAEVVATAGAEQHYTDDGSLAVDAGTAPLPLGSLGVWHPVADLVTARQGAAVVAVPDPNDASITYLHVLGGLSGGAALDSAERATLVATSSSRQTVSAFTQAAGVVPNARGLTAAVFVDASQLSILPGTDAWLYLLPGLSGTGAPVSHVTAYPLDTADGVGADDGSLGAPVEVDSPVASAGGYGAVARNGFLYILAGAGTADSAGKAAQICPATGAGCSSVPPDLVMWNAGIQMTGGRVHSGTASESGFVFLLGGQTETSPATRTTESTNI